MLKFLGVFMVLVFEMRTLADMYLNKSQMDLPLFAMFYYVFELTVLHPSSYIITFKAHF